jgi:hypothetical protein
MTKATKTRTMFGGKGQQQQQQPNLQLFATIYSILFSSPPSFIELPQSERKNLKKRITKK